LASGHTEEKRLEAAAQEARERAAGLKAEVGASSQQSSLMVALMAARAKGEVSGLYGRLGECDAWVQVLCVCPAAATILLWNIRAWQRIEGPLCAFDIQLRASDAGSCACCNDANMLSGIHCHAGDLGAIDPQYDVAVSTAVGALDYVVVETASDAQRCVEYLRRWEQVARCGLSFQ
jgi:chromosome segregation ATPase